MSAHLTSRIAVVTGAGSGVGQAAAVALAACGARIALVGRTLEKLNTTARQIRGAGGTAELFPSDVSHPEAAAALKEAIETRLGPPSILVNAAGTFGPIQPIMESDPARWINTLLVNTAGPYLLCRAFVKAMVESGWGRIINVSSAASLHAPGPMNSAYATSKAALNHLTRHLAAEISGTGVTANVIHPGDIKTGMWADIRDQATALGPAGAGYLQWVDWVEETGGDPVEKAASLVLRLVSDEASSINGQFLWIEDGLQSPVPAWAGHPPPPPWTKE